MRDKNSSREYSRKWMWVKRRSDPEFAKNERDNHKVWLAKAKQDPEYLEHYKELNREAQQRYLANPKHRSEHLKLVNRWKQTHKEQVRETKHRSNKRLLTKYRAEVLAHYSGGFLRCNKCGYSANVLALTLDHENGGGSAHRRQVGTGLRFYRWLRKNNYPSGFQVLCMNCQFIKLAEEREKYWSARKHV